MVLLISPKRPQLPPRSGSANQQTPSTAAHANKPFQRLTLSFNISLRFIHHSELSCHYVSCKSTDPSLIVHPSFAFGSPHDFLIIADKRHDIPRHVPGSRRTAYRIARYCLMVINQISHSGRICPPNPAAALSLQGNIVFGNRLTDPGQSILSACKPSQLDEAQRCQPHLTEPFFLVS